MNNPELREAVESSTTVGRSMGDSELREVAESLDRGDKVTVGKLDFAFTVTQTIEHSDHDSISVFGEKRNCPKQGLLTSVMFGVDNPDFNPQIEVTINVYEGEAAVGRSEQGEQVKQWTYDTLENITVVE